MLAAEQGTKQSKNSNPEEKSQDTANTHDKRAIRGAFKTNGRLVAAKNLQFSIRVQLNGERAYGHT
jgi:hypothetical protein